MPQPRILVVDDDPKTVGSVGDLDVDADVDCGSRGGFSLPEALVDKLALDGEPKVVGLARTVSNSFEIKAAPLKGDVMLGSMRFASPTLEFQLVFPMANVGSKVLRDFRVTFDQKNHRMRLARPS